MNIMILDLFIISIALFRITNLFVYELGPFWIFDKIRNKFGIHRLEFPDGSVQFTNINKSDKNLINGWLDCFWCFNLILSIFVCIVYLLIPQLIYILLPFAISGISIYIKETIK